MQRYDAPTFGGPSHAQMTDQVDAGGEAMEDIEHEGRFYRIPLALKDAFMAKAEYAQRANELAALRDALENDRQGFEQTQATAADRVRLALIDDQLEEFEGVDWELFAQEDPQGAQGLWAKYQELAQVRERYAWSLARNEHEGRLQAERETAARLAETGRVLATEIDGWSPEVAGKLVEYAGAFGVTLEELREVADPRLWKILHRAHIGDELAQRQEAGRQAEQLQAVRPAVQVTGAAASGAGVRDELGTKEWMQRRNQQAFTGR